MNPIYHQTVKRLLSSCVKAIVNATSNAKIDNFADAISTSATTTSPQSAPSTARVTSMKSQKQFVCVWKLPFWPTAIQLLKGEHFQKRGKGPWQPSSFLCFFKKNNFVLKFYWESKLERCQLSLLRFVSKFPVKVNLCWSSPSLAPKKRGSGYNFRPSLLFREFCRNLVN